MQILETQTELRAAKHVKSSGLAWRCGDCGKVTELGATEGCGTGYGYAGHNPDAKPICYDCCGKRDIARMTETGRATLYLTKECVTNWPGTLKFKPHYRRTGRHNFAGKRFDVWFTGPDGTNWHGVTYGENTQICHCKRTKN